MNFKLKIALLSATIMLSIPLGPITTHAASVQSTMSSGTVLSGVYLRDKPSTSGKVIRLLKTGESVTILEHTNGYFYRLRTSTGVVGYASSAEKYIGVSSQKSDESTGQASPKGQTVQNDQTRQNEQTGQSGQTVQNEEASADQRYGSVKVNLNLRDQPSMSSRVVGLLKTGERLTILDDSNTYFYKIKTESGKVGYVSSQQKYVQTSAVSHPSGGVREEQTSGQGSDQTSGQTANVSESLQVQIDKLFAVGKSYLGTPYEYGSDRNTTATFDCSDFVRTAYREALGINLPADSRSQGDWVRKNSKPVYNIADLIPGDLVFFKGYDGSTTAEGQNVNPGEPRINHVAIYLGDGQLLQTYSVNSGGVRIDNFTNTWQRRFLFGGSVLK